MILMYGGYMYFYTPAEEISTEKPKTEIKLEANTESQLNPVAQIITDTAALKSQFGSFSKVMSGDDKIITLENENLIVDLNTKGGKIAKVTLKKYKTYDSFISGKEVPMVLIDDQNSTLKLEAATNFGNIDLANLFYQVGEQDKNKVTFTADIGNGQLIEQTYQLNENAYDVDYNLKLSNTDGLIKNEPIKFSWENKLKKLEHDLKENRKAAQVNYYTAEESFEDLGLGSNGDNKESVSEDVKWISFKQKYFTSGIISENSFFKSLNIDLKTPLEDSMVVKDAMISAAIPLDNLKTGNGNFKFYFGPNEFSILKAIGNDFHQNLYLGYDIVKPINRFIFVPLFNWFEKFITNYGILIILVVLAIKTALTPLIYKSYVSSAKMRVLGPEIAEIKERVGDDAVKVQQETMKLYQQVGVSPLSGCIPMVLQMPILMSVFFLFPNMIMFRQKGFLWASDLSTYDSPLSWGFDLPVIGNHISLFVVLMTASSLAFTYYNNQVTPDQPGPIDMKKISYIFPLVFFFVLNSFPAALSFYYLVSNVVTIGQQLLVKRFIDEDKIKNILHENKKNFHTKPKKTNKFADYLQKQLQTQEELNKQKAESLKKRKNK